MRGMLLEAEIKFLFFCDAARHLLISPWRPSVGWMAWIPFTTGEVFRLRQHNQTKRRLVNYSSYLGILPVNNAKCEVDHNFSSSVELKNVELYLRAP